MKKKDSEAVIIPVLLKTGYVTKEDQRDYEKRKVVFIGYEHIYNIFTAHSNQLHEQVIVQTWWQNFYEKYYRPIQAIKSLEINSQSTLKHFNRLCKTQKYPTNLAFHIITDYLFGDIEELQSIRHRVQGKGHADWHFQIQNKLWRNQRKKIRLNINLTWDLQNFSFVIKTVPIPYKSKKRLNATEKIQYATLQKFIKTEIKDLQLSDWKITNYYLTIARLPHIEDMSLHTLKKKIKEDVTQLSKKFDEIMSE